MKPFEIWYIYIFDEAEKLSWVDNLESNWRCQRKSQNSVQISKILGYSWGTFTVTVESLLSYEPVLVGFFSFFPSLFAGPVVAL